MSQFSAESVRYGNKNGAGRVTRTPDLRITNALLYQLSYAGTDPGLRKGAEYRQSGFFPQASSPLFYS